MRKWVVALPLADTAIDIRAMYSQLQRLQASTSAVAESLAIAFLARFLRTPISYKRHFGITEQIG